MTNRNEEETATKSMRIGLYTISKILTAIVSSLVLSIWFSSGNSDNFIIFLVVITPIYFIGGIPISILVDVLTRKLTLSNIYKYLFSLLLYALGGFVVMFIFMLIISSNRSPFSELLSFTFLGVVASIFGYHVLLIVNALLNRLFVSDKN
ncbi:hypothetical protein NV379_17550 [Paenibacillus sp. N1-5-1-14]|uniref:hypothetical protein n=1 Tax=Paenibacillus radicibacter TaxID=2972488 RepID=UPI0021599D4A|nr:hypothetical protein [Paenibacillus radicibacter]MCR8644463.1 hypothetical protein [Paenibacillus radicibacter]